MRPYLRRGYRLTRDVGASARSRRRLVSGHRVVWLRPEVADLESFRTLAPGPGQVLLRTRTSLVSPGTERAFLLGLPNTNASFPTIPGYSAAGVVEAVGRGVSRLGIGDRVAGVAPHASLAVVPSNMLVRVPEGVPDESACFVELAVIAMQGVRRARLQPGERVVVLGLGLVGQLALQFARWTGAAPLVAVARTAQGFEAARAGGADMCVELAAHLGSAADLAADVVLEATGSPSAIVTAIECARPGGRVVLLGSSRGMTAGVDFQRLVAARGVEVIGAHISSLAARDSTTGRWTRHDESELFLDLVSSGRLNMGPLITRRAAPEEANAVYDDLVGGRERPIGIVFDWTRLGRSQPSMTPAAASVSHTAPSGPPLGVGLVGCGEISAHNAAGIRASTHCRLVQVMDVNEDAARSLGKQFGVSHTAQLEELLANPAVETVVIGIPHHLHASVTAQAARAGKHVIVEKPIATTLADADAMIAACRDARVALSILFSFRYQPHIERARELIRAGALGRVVGTHISFTTEKPAGYWGQGYTGRVLTDWRGSKQKCGGGVLIMNVCHTIDYFRYVTGLEVERVYSEFATENSPVEVEDIIAVSLRYAGGGIGSIDAATLGRDEKRAEERIWGTHGTMVLSPGPPQIYTLRKVAGMQPGKWQALGKLPTINRVATYMDRFAASVRAGREPEITGEDGRVNLAVVLAAYEAGEVGHAVQPQVVPSPTGEVRAS